jgi:hypothetical protein
MHNTIEPQTETPKRYLASALGMFRPSEPYAGLERCPPDHQEPYGPWLLAALASPARTLVRSGRRTCVGNLSSMRLFLRLEGRFAFFAR